MKTQDKRQLVELREHLSARELRARVEPVLSELERMGAEVTQVC